MWLTKFYIPVLFGSQDFATAFADTEALCLQYMSILRDGDAAHISSSRARAPGDMRVK